MFKPNPPAVETKQVQREENNPAIDTIQRLMVEYEERMKKLQMVIESLKLVLQDLAA